MITGITNGPLKKSTEEKNVVTRMAFHKHPTLPSHQVFTDAQDTALFGWQGPLGSGIEREKQSLPSSKSNSGDENLKKPIIMQYAKF